MKKAESQQIEQAGYDIPEWCAAVRISRATYYKLDGELKPGSVKIGKRHIITESPADYMARLAVAQAVAA